MTAQDLIAHATVLAYRLAGYALQNMAEDAALLFEVYWELGKTDKIPDRFDLFNSYFLLYKL